MSRLVWKVCLVQPISWLRLWLRSFDAPHIFTVNFQNLGRAICELSSQTSLLNPCLSQYRKLVSDRFSNCYGTDNLKFVLDMCTTIGGPIQCVVSYRDQCAHNTLINGRR